MAKLTLTDPANFNSTTLAQIAQNNNLIEAALENTLSRNGTSPNQMAADLDMNHNDILNVDNINVETLVLNGVVVSLSDLLIGSSGDAVVDTYILASAYSSDAAPTSIRTKGYSTVGDGGAGFYKRVSAEPSHPGKFSITLLDTTVHWYELEVPVAVPEMFGAAQFSTQATDATTPPTTDLSTMTDSTEALLDWAEYVNENNTVGFLPSLYRSTSSLAFTKPGLSIEGINARTSGILFDGCPGITLDLGFGVTLKYSTQAALFANLVPVAGVKAVVTNNTVNNGVYVKVGGTGTGSWTKTSELFAAQGTRYAFRKFSMLTNSDRALGYTGIDVNCMYSPGGADTFRIIEEMYFAGQRMFETQNQLTVMTAETGTNRKQAWAKAIDLLESDNTVVRDNRIHGPIFDWNQGFTGSDISYSVYTKGCTALECVRNKSLFSTYGFRIGGASEATLMQDNVAGANRGGYIYEALVDDDGTPAAANWHKFIRNHASCYDFGVSFNLDGATPGGSQFNIFRGNLIFLYPGAATIGGYTHMRLQTSVCDISSNLFFVSTTNDARFASGLVAEAIKIEGNFNRIDANTFSGLDRCITIDSGSVSTKITNNITQGSAYDEPGAAPPIVYTDFPLYDSGTDTVCMFNSGDAKAELWPANFYDGEKKIDLWSHQAVEIYGGATSSKYQKASFPNVAGTPVNYLEFVASATGSPVFMRAAGSDTNISLRLIPKGAGRVRFGTRTASGDVAVTGYIEIEDSGGTVRRLAVVG